MEPKISVTYPIIFPDGTMLEGAAPLVLIGPNGAGKTRFGTNMVTKSGYDRIPALRSLNFDTSIPFQKREDAKRDADNQINQTRANPWQMVSELTHVLSELKAEDSQSAIEFRDRFDGGDTAAKPEVTNLKKLGVLWRLIFPGRALDLSTYDPKVKWDHPSRATGQYNANQMSDGERSALYLITRILRANSGVVIVDEPEVHFHSLLARAFWDVVEAERPDCRFVYITHDLPFALSRGGARIGIVRTAKEVELVPEDAPIPPEIYESILGAASLSVVAKRIVFCEGKYDRSVDIHIYGAWFQSPDSVVVPVGNCNEVRQAVAVFKANPVIANAEAIGIVERDYWSDAYLATVAADGLHVLPANEIEGLLCLRDVAAAVAQKLAAPDFATKYTEFENAVRRQFTGIRLHKQILERAKRDIDVRLMGLANAAHPDADPATTRRNFVGTIDLARAVPDIGAVFDEHSTIIHTALAGAAADFLKVLPGKDCLNILCQGLGVTKDTYLNLITSALNQPDTDGDPDLETLRAALVAALAPHLPTRI
jgi:hypothetical protein